MLKALIIASSLVVAGSAFAQTAPNGTPMSSQQDMQNDPRQTIGPDGRPMTTAPVSNPTPNAVAGPHNSTGNMNTKGAGPGTTGTGSTGGSGNQ